MPCAESGQIAATMKPIITSTPPIRILLVEDEFLISAWVEQSLSEQGFRVRTAANAAEALRYLAAAPVDVLFTDINLGGDMDGVTLAQRAREFLPDLPVVYASAQVGLAGLDRPVPGSIFVPKPYAPESVGRLLAKAFASTECRALA